MDVVYIVNSQWSLLFPEVLFLCQHRIRSINNLKKLLTKYVIKCMYLNGGAISKSSQSSMKFDVQRKPEFILATEYVSLPAFSVV